MKLQYIIDSENCSAIAVKKAGTLTRQLLGHC